MVNRLPPWFRQELPDREIVDSRFKLLRQYNLHTVCTSAHCPNLGSCFKEGSLTFMILGETCTRNCSFCAVEKANGNTLDLDLDEPKKLAKAIRDLALEYVVLTSVTRDDLADGGASQFAEAIIQIRAKNPNAKIELLIPDFQGSFAALKGIIDLAPEVIAHNLETVPRLYKMTRKDADYRRSLNILGYINKTGPSIYTKSSIMLGMGEGRQEVKDLMFDLRCLGCDILTIGQYLAPSVAHFKVKEFISLEQFKAWKEFALSLGFKAVLSSPLVRSSFKAKEIFQGLN